jgi:DNA anti-recombination protein RmuC
MKLQLDTLAVELQDARLKAEGGERLKSETELFRKDVDSLRERDRHHQEMITQLQQNLSYMSERADSQARKAIEVIEALNSKNKKLQAEFQETISKFSDQDIGGLKQEREELQQRLDENLERITDCRKS